MKIFDWLNINKLLSTTNFVLVLCGVQFVTSVFIGYDVDIEGATRIVTVPYRIFALTLSLIVIFFNIRTKLINNTYTLVFIFFCFIFTVRLLGDIFFFLDLGVQNQSNKMNLLVGYFGFTIPALLSVALSWRNIMYSHVFTFFYILVTLTLCFTMLSNPLLFTEGGETRINGNAAISTISFGYLGCTEIILSLWQLKIRKKSLLNLLTIIFTIGLGVFSLLRSGSQGPILSLLIVMIFYLFVKRKIIGTILVLLYLIFSKYFIGIFLTFVGSISPIIEARLALTFFEKNLNGREFIWDQAYNVFSKNPFFGNQFVIFLENGEIDYTHNIFLDILISTGIFGFMLFLVIFFKSLSRSIFVLKKQSSSGWLSLIFIQQLAFNLTSGAFYLNPVLMSIIFILLSSFNDIGKLNLTNGD